MGSPVKGEEKRMLPPLPPLSLQRWGVLPPSAAAAMLRAVISERPAPEKLVVAAVHATFLRSRRVRSRTRRAPSRSGGGGKTRTILQLKRVFRKARHLSVW